MLVIVFTMARMIMTGRRLLSPSTIKKGISLDFRSTYPSSLNVYDDCESVIRENVHWREIFLRNDSLRSKRNVFMLSKGERERRNTSLDRCRRSTQRDHEARNNNNKTGIPCCRGPRKNQRRLFSFFAS